MEGLQQAQSSWTQSKIHGIDGCLKQGRGSWTKSKKDRISGGLTAGTRSLNKVQGGQNILRAYSKDMVLYQSPRRTEYIEGLQRRQVSWTKSKDYRIYGGFTTRTSSLNKVQGWQNIWKAYSKDKTLEQSPRRTEFIEGLKQGQAVEGQVRRRQHIRELTGRFPKKVHVGQTVWRNYSNYKVPEHKVQGGQNTVYGRGTQFYIIIIRETAVELGWWAEEGV